MLPASSWNDAAFLPMASISPTRLCASAEFEWYVKITSTPRRARLTAVLRPRPRLPPVIIAVLQFPLFTISSLPGVLPGNDAVHVGEGSCGTISSEQRQPKDLSRTLGNRLRPAMLIEIGCRVAWVD